MRVHADNASVERDAEFKVTGTVRAVMRKTPGQPAAPDRCATRRIIAMFRAKAEQPFRVNKRKFGYVKTREQGLAKKRSQLLTLLALAPLFSVRGRLMACPCSGSLTVILSQKSSSCCTGSYSAPISALPHLSIRCSLG